MKLIVPSSQPPWAAALAAWTAAMLVVAAQPSGSGADAAPAELAVSKQHIQSKNKTVQLGITVSKPGALVYAQLPKLPRGSGFIVDTVTIGGAVSVAGLKPMDIVWKLDDQILINENQLMTLLSLYEPGDKVEASYFRSGLEKVTTIELQQGRVQPKNVANIAVFSATPGRVPTFTQIGQSGGDLPALPTHVISYEDRSASISDENGIATLTFREGKPWLHVESAQGVETYNSPVNEASDIARVPLVWRGRLPILKRALEESVRLRRVPRIRYVPKQKHRFAGGKGGK